MPIFGWVRDVHGLWKNMQEAKKTRLEIEKIEDEKREHLIKPPTLDDIKKYDPKTRMIIEKSGGGCILQVASCLGVLLLLASSIYLFAR